MSENPPIPRKQTSSSSIALFDTDIILSHLGVFGRFQLMFFVCLAYAVLFPIASILVFSLTGATPAHRWLSFNNYLYNNLNFLFIFFIFVYYRCFIDGCDNTTNPQYLAEWIDNSTTLTLDEVISIWRCQLPNSTTATCESNNYTANTSCQRWIYDKSIFISTIVSDVSPILFLFFSSQPFIYSFFIVWFSLQQFLEGYFRIVSYNGRRDGWCFYSRATTWFVSRRHLFLNWQNPIKSLYFRIGRRKAVLILSVWMNVFAIGSSFAPNYTTFAALRFLTGMGGIALMQSLMIWGKLTINF